MNIWSIDKSPPPGVLKAPIPPRHVPTNVPGLRPPVPARWEVKAGASGRPYLVDNNTGTTHRTSPGDGSHQRSGTPATPPIPSAPQSTAPGQESHHHRRHPGDARDSPELRANERLRPDEELARRIKELDAITEPAVIEIVKDMEESSKIIQAQSKTITKALETMSLDSFEDAVSAFQAEGSSQQTGTEASFSRGTSLRDTMEPELFRDVIGDSIEHGHGEEEDSGISVEGQDHESGAVTSDSEDWEDCTDDEETMAEDDNGSR
ncbi:hypothetical protein MRS44_008495 [Fusarium solani]|nr:hypothetical protein MRS44_008495 [Fusarium solani]